jgi:endonuclease G
VTRDGYALQHSSLDRIPLWVCEAVDRADLLGDQPRVNNFHPDPKLPADERSELSDYKGSGFDRGHLAPAGNQTVSKERKEETFFLSNIAPQEGKKFNQSIWAALEDRARSWVADQKITEAKVITGVFFYDPEEDDENTADGVIEYSVIGDNKVAVPTHFFKIVVGRFADGTLNAIAFMMPNVPHNPPFQFAKYIVSIDFLAEKSGFNYLPDLDPLEEQRLERNPSPMWFQ